MTPTANPTPIDAWVAEQQAWHRSEVHGDGYLGDESSIEHCTCGYGDWPCPEPAKLAVIAAAATQEHFDDTAYEPHVFGGPRDTDTPCAQCAALTALTTDGGAHGESR